jgi:autotransporter-associated beta strand protein
VTVNGGNLGVLANQTIGGLNLANGLITGTGTLSSPGTFLLQNGSLSTPLAGAGSVIVNGIGNIVTMTGPSSYTGSTTVLAGTLVLDGGDNILPAGTSLILGNTLDTTDAGVLQLGSTVHSNVTFSTIASNSTAPNAIVGGLGGAPSVLSLTGNFVNSVTLGGGGSGQNNILVNINGGNVEMDGASTYTGGTSITNNGTMVVDAIGGVGPGVITLNNGTITQNTIADLTSGGRSLSLVGGGGIINVGSNNETYAGTFTGSGPLAINGTSGTVINATGTNPTFSGPLNAENVTLDFAGSNNYGTGNLTLSNASLILTTASSAPVNNIVVNGAATISFNANNIGPGAIFGSGTLTLLSNNGGGSNLGDLNGNMSGFAGTVVINTGELVRMNGASGSALAIWNLQNSSSFNNRNATSTTSPNLLGGLIGTVGTNISGQQTGSGNTYYQIGAAIGSGNSTEFDGSVTDNAPNSAWTGVIIVGNGTQIFGGTGNTYSLGTTILSGTLALKGPGTLGAPSAGGNANITFGTNTTIGGTLDVSLEASPLVLSNLTVVNGNGTIVTGSSNVTIAGTLASGFNSTLSGNVGNVAGTINVNGTVQVSGNTDFFINGNTTGSYNTIALANSGSTLDLVNSILNLTFGYTPSYGDSITLVALNGGSVDDSGLTINPIGLPGGDVIINNLPTTGQIDVVPEPAVWGLALGLMSLAVCRWRKRS